MHALGMQHCMNIGGVSLGIFGNILSKSGEVGWCICFSVFSAPRLSPDVKGAILSKFLILSFQRFQVVHATAKTQGILLCSRQFGLESMHSSDMLVYGFSDHPHICSKSTSMTCFGQVVLDCSFVTQCATLLFDP